MDEPLEIEPDKKVIGALLQAEREKQKLSREQVAKELNLSESMIIALENDQEVNEISPTYIRGYQRAYVRLLGLNESEVLSDLVYVRESERPQPDLHYFDKSFDISGKKNWGGFFTKILTVIVLLAIAFLSWPKISSFLSISNDERVTESSSQFEIQVLENNSGTEQAGTTSKSNSAVADDSKQENSEQDLLLTTQDNTVVTQIVKLPVELDQSGQFEQQADVKENNDQTNEQMESKITELLAVENQSAVQSDQGSEIDGQTALLSVNQQEAPATITFISNGESWLTVTDAKNTRLFRRNLKLDRVKVTGFLPFEVRAGNVSVLRVLAEQGEQQKVGIFDESKTVARFSLDLETDGQLKFTPK